MRELRPKPVRLNSSHTGVPALPPPAKEDGLAAIMARRRQAADSTAAVKEDPFVKSAKRAAAALINRNESISDDDLLVAMQKRRQHVERSSSGDGQQQYTSPRQSRPKLSQLAHNTPLNPDLMDRITSRAPLQQSPRTGRDSPDAYRHPVLQVEKALTKRFGSLEDPQDGAGDDDDKPAAAEFQSARADLAHIPIEEEEEEEEDDPSHSSHEPLLEQLVGSSNGNNHHHSNDNNDNCDDSFVTDYTAADASVQEQSYAESHARSTVQRTDSCQTDESSVTGLVADVLTVSDHSDANEPSQSETESHDGDDDPMDEEQDDDEANSNNNNNNRGSRHHSSFQSNHHNSSRNHSANYYYTSDEDVTVDQHGGDNDTAIDDNGGAAAAAAIDRDQFKRQLSGDSANHHSTLTTSDETIELLDIVDDDDDEYDDGGAESYSSNEFPENGEEFSTDDNMDDFYSDEDDEGMMSDGGYTDDDQEPYYTGDDEDDGDMPRGSDDDSFYEEETYYSSTPQPERNDSFLTEQTVESDEDGGGRSYYSAPPLRNESGFSMRSMNTIGTLGTLSEEGTVDLEEEEDSELSQNEGGRGSSFEERTGYPSELGGRSVFGEHATIHEGDEEDASTTATAERSTTRAPTFDVSKTVFEKTNVEADSSFYSTNAGNSHSTGRSSAEAQEEPGLSSDDDYDEHYDDFNVTDMNRVSNNSYDAERSILGSLSVLDAVPEESTCNESQLSGDDKSIDESTIFGTRLGVSDDDAKGNSGPLPSRLTDSIDIEGGYVSKQSFGGSRQSLSGSRQSLGDSSLEQAPRKPRRGKKPVNKKLNDSPSQKVNRFCTLPLLTAIVLVVSLGVGVIVGIIIFGGSKKKDENSIDTPADEDDVPAPSPVAPPVEARPDLPEENLKVYDLICSALDGDCELLLDISSPQGQAFDWLINDQMANPDLEAWGEEKQIQRYALATFYHSTGGASWANRLNWLSDQHECQWFSSSKAGSGCSDGETFDTLELNYNNLQGEIPREVFLLASLKSISLINPVDTPPFLRGSLPSGWEALTSLTSLTISGNQFSGSLPEELGKLKNLESLDLSYNAFNGEIPSTFSHLSKMKSLNLAGNVLIGNIDERIFQGAKALVSINLARNRFTGVPSTVVLLTKLRTLNMASNKLSDFPYVVTSLTQLTSLDLQGNGFKNEIPFQIGKMAGLKSLNLSNNKFSSEIPVEIGKLVELSQLLDLSNNELSGPIPTTIGSLVRLQRLLLNGNQLQGDLPVELASLTLVKEVRYDENDFTGFVPDDVCTLYNQEPSPTSYADCEELILASCFTYCCADGVGCFCRFEKTEPLRCVKGPQR